MSDFQAIADRVEIEALRGEFTDAVMMRDRARTRDGRQGLNYAIYHDRYQRTGDGWKFTERVYEIRVPRHQSAGGLGAPRGGGAR